jgi:endoglucanase
MTPLFLKSFTASRKTFNSLLLLFLLSVLLLACSKDPDVEPPVVVDPPVVIPPASNAITVIDSMETGFNLGNTFDLAQHPTTLETIRPIIDLYYNAGMRHVRFPVTWMDGFSDNTLADANGSINFQHPRFIQLKAAIDYALERKMYVVLNTHHENWLKDNYDGSASYDAIFTTLWTGIATHFKDYSHRLVFEVLNEPEGAFGDWSAPGPNPLDAQAIALTRQINKVGYDAIRKTGGANTERIIMVSTNAQGNQSQLNDVYPAKENLPGGGTDVYLAIQVHTYDPWEFCGQTGKNTAWPGSSAIESTIRGVAAHARLLNVAVNYGEFGVGRQSNTAERNTDVVREFYRTLRLTVLSENMSPTVWDDRGWFALVAKDASGMYQFMNDIVPSMLAP